MRLRSLVLPNAKGGAASRHVGGWQGHSTAAARIPRHIPPVSSHPGPAQHPETRGKHLPPKVNY